MPGSGIAPYGLRYGGDVPLSENPLPKGKGFFGMLQRPDGGTSSELSADNMPLLVPTLSVSEIKHLLAGGQPTGEMLAKASAWAEQRRAQGLSPFAGPSDLRMDVADALGGK